MPVLNIPPLAYAAPSFLSDSGERLSLDTMTSAALTPMQSSTPRPCFLRNMACSSGDSPPSISTASLSHFSNASSPVSLLISPNFPIGSFPARPAHGWS